MRGRCISAACYEILGLAKHIAYRYPSAASGRAICCASFSRMTANAYDPTAARVVEKPFEELDRGGMGLTLIRHAAAFTRYEREGGMNVFTLDFPL